MAGNSQRKGAIRKSGRGATVGSGGRGKQKLEGKGPTPKAVDRAHHPAAKRKRAAGQQEAGLQFSDQDVLPCPSVSQDRRTRAMPPAITLACRVAGWVTPVAARNVVVPARIAVSRSMGSSRVSPQPQAAQRAMTEEVAATVRFLCTDAPPSMTGAVLDVNGASYVR